MKRRPPDAALLAAALIAAGVVIPPLAWLATGVLLIAAAVAATVAAASLFDASPKPFLRLMSLITLARATPDPAEAPAPAPTPPGGEAVSMTFGEALAHLKAGHRVTRAGWNGRGMWIFLVPGSTITVAADRPLGQAAPHLVGREIEYRPHIDMFTADGQIVPWVATQSDLLADDWILLSDFDPAVVKGDTAGSASAHMATQPGQVWPADCEAYVPLDRPRGLDAEQGYVQVVPIQWCARPFVLDEVVRVGDAQGRRANAVYVGRITVPDEPDDHVVGFCIDGLLDPVLPASTPAHSDTSTDGEDNQ
ncbi:DUF2829 domain-containing protein [Nonomuraea sp. NPDC003214]